MIAHELGHVALGHARRRMIDFSGQMLLEWLWEAFFQGVLPGIGGIVANVLSNLLMARLSRADELKLMNTHLH